MKIILAKNYSSSALQELVRRTPESKCGVESKVREILQNVRKNKDEALFALTKQLDGVELATLRVLPEEIKEAYKKDQPEVITALKKAKNAIMKFQSSIIKREPKIRTEKGVNVWREFRPIERVGLYVPGGKAAYPSTVLMLGIPARIAGCKEVVLCVPPGKDGNAPSAVLVAADLCGITKIFKVGGAQAIAAMAYGTESVPKVSKVFGPGNQYVTTAKMQVYGEVDIDMPAGPTEVLIFADETAIPAFVAADMLAQLEHSEDAQAVLVTRSEKVAQQVQQELVRQLPLLSRQDIIRRALRSSFGLVFSKLIDALSFINDYAPEHLEIMSRDEAKIIPRITNAGSVFLGSYTGGPLGDYATGSNHTLPTSGYSKMFSPLSVESFGKKMQIQKVNRAGLFTIGKTVETLAEREGLDAHKNAIHIRYKRNYKKLS